MGRLQDRVAIITGGGGGIGIATARLFVDEGAKVVLTDTNADAVADAAKAVGCEFYHHDVTDEARWAEIVDSVESAYGGLHVLVNGAGIEGDLSLGNPVDVTLEEWRRVYGVNVDGVMLGCRSALPAIQRAGGGSIINISSMVAFFAMPFSAPYASSKAAVANLSKSVAMYGANKGVASVRCNSVHPGRIRTQMLRNISEFRSRRQNLSVEEIETASAEDLPLARLGEPEDVARMILFLASDESSYVTGCEFRVDGGWGLKN